MTKDKNFLPLEKPTADVILQLNAILKPYGWYVSYVEGRGAWGGFYIAYGPNTHPGHGQISSEMVALLATILKSKP